MYTESTFVLVLQDNFFDDEMLTLFCLSADELEYNFEVLVDKFINQIGGIEHVTDLELKIFTFKFFHFDLPILVLMRVLFLNFIFVVDINM